MKFNNIFLYAVFIFMSNVSIFAQFHQVGPYGGLINSITKDDQGRILAATYLGGIFRSSDNGNTWEKITNDTLKADYRSVAVNSNGDIFGGTDGFGILRSTDNGVTWERIMNAFSSSTITALAVKADRLFIGSFDGLFYSDNKGNSINSVNGISTSIDIYSIAVNGNGDLYTGTYYNGVFRSTDNGVNWSAASNGLTFNNLIIMGFAFNSSGNIVTTNGVKVYSSSDGGNNWNDLNAPTDNYLSVAVGTNDNIFAAATSKIYRTTNGGTNWDTLGSWPENTSSLTKLFRTGGYIFAGTAGVGVFNSSDDGDSWSLGISGMTNTHINEIAGGTNGELYAATSYAGIFFSSDNGGTWENRTNNLPISNWLTTVAVNPKTGTVFIATKFDYCYRSTVKGDTWEKMTNLGVFPAVTFEFNSEGEIYAGYFDRFYKSTDDGITWNQKFPNVSPISDIAIGLSDYVYLATDGAGVYLSTDGGEIWNPSNDGLTDLNIRFIEAFTDTTSSLGKKADESCKVDCATKDAIFTFNGTSWAASQYDIFILELMKVTGESNKERIIWFAASLLYAKDPTCAASILNKTTISADEPISAFAKIPPNAKLLKPNNTSLDLELLVGTKGGGIYRGIVSPTGVEPTNNSIPDNFYLAQNYPNPFNPSTTIRYKIPQTSFVTLKIYDILGREDATLINEEKSAGNYEVRFNASQLSSGVYFYALKAGEFAQTKKLILMK